MKDCESKFQRIFESGQFSRLSEVSDARLVTNDGCSFKIHKVILGSVSDFFRGMFCGLSKDKEVHKVLNMSGNCLAEILCYIYKNNICVTETNIKDLLIAADYLLLKDLYLKLKENVKNHITYANCLELCNAMYELGDKDVFEICFTFIQTNYEQIQKDDLINFPVDLLRSILSNRNLNVESERTVWQTIIFWAEECIESRLKSVPRLLSTIAIDEVDENLAKEILNHDIINHHMKSLNSIQSFNVIDSHCDLLRSFLQKHSNDFPLQNFRIPRKLNIISKRTREYNEQETCDIFVSYDETLRLHRKITNVHFEPEYLKVVENDLYIFEKYGTRCVKVNLKTMVCLSMINITYNSHEIHVIENCIYMVGYDSEGAYNMTVYNTVEDRCDPVGPLNHLRDGSAVTMGKVLFIVGVSSALDGMIMMKLNTNTNEWIPLAPPKLIRSGFQLISYNGEIYLVGGVNAFYDPVTAIEVYNCATNNWHNIAPLPYNYSYKVGIVLNEQLYIYNKWMSHETDRNEATYPPVKLNQKKQIWDNVEQRNFPEKLSQNRFCIIEDSETIKYMTKQNRKPTTKMVKSPFNILESA